MSETAVPGLSRGWRRAGAALALLGLVGCSSGTPTGPEAGAALVGPTWRVTTVAGQLILAGTTLTAEFSGEDRVAGSAGCNSYFGRARVEAGRLSVGPLGSTLMACVRDGLMEQEGRYLAALQAATSYSIRGEELRLGPLQALPRHRWLADEGAAFALLERELPPSSGSRTGVWHLQAK